MAKLAQKVTLSPSRDIPFDKLVLSQSNVRRIKAGVSVEELAEDIARRGLLQGLNVRPVLDADGVETGMFEIPAGGRRFQALSLLVKQKRLAKSAPIPCIVRDAASEILAEDDSLAENMQRVALHPLDQFRAFQTLREKGQGEEAIAAAFFVTPQIVKQRLKLASVAPALLEVYADDGMTLEQLMAFTVNPDHARQVQVWDAVKNSWNKEPYAIRRTLTETSVRASDRRAVFVGVDAYEAAGGVVLRDLFQGDDGGWLEDPALLDRLVAEKLQAEAEALASEGWKWIEVAPDLPYGYSHGTRRLAGDPAPMTEEESAAHATLLAEYRALEEEYSGKDEYPEEIDARLGQLEMAMEALEQRPLICDPAEVARAGVFVTLDRDGSLAVYRGYVRPEDEPHEQTAVQNADGADVMGQGGDVGSSGWSPSAITVGGTVITSGGQPIGADLSEEDDDGALKPLPERLVMELTAHRTLALREAIGRSPDVALTLLLLKLVTDNRAIDAATATSDFSFRDIRRRPHAIYLVVESEMIRPLAPLIRLFFSDLIASLQAQEPGDDEPWPVMIMLDEFDRLGKMPIVAESIKTLRSFGGNLAIVTQTIPALDEIYGENTRRSLQGGAGVKLYLTPSEQKTIEELSQAVGKTTKRVVTRSRAVGRNPFEGRSVSERTEDTPLLTEDQARRMDLDEVILVIDAQMPIRALRIKYFEDPALKVLHAGQAGSFPYPDEDGLRRDRQMTETRVTVEKLKQELQEVRAAEGTQGTASSSMTVDAPATETQDPKPTLSGRARGRAARDAAAGGGSGQLSLDLARLGLREADSTKLTAAVQTTRAIIAEYA